VCERRDRDVGTLSAAAAAAAAAVAAVVAAARSGWMPY